MAISKAKAIGVVRYNVGTPALRTFIKGQLGNKTKMKSQEDGLALLDAHFTKDQIEDFIFENFFSLKHHCYIYETQSPSAFNQTTIRTRLGQNFLDISADIGAIIDHDSTTLSLCGYAYSTVLGQKFDEGNGQYVGQSKTIDTHVPFELIFSPPNHVKLKISKFVPSIVLDNQGNELTVLENHFDEEGLAEAVLDIVISHYSSDNFVRSNLTTAIKNLVQSQRIGTLLAKAQDANGAGIEQRTKNKVTGQSCFVEMAWHNQYLIPSPRIGRTKWYWIENGNPVPDDTKGLVSHTVDPDKGKVSQDTYSKVDQEAYINEIISRNT